MEVYEPFRGPRIDSAIEQLRQGIPLDFGGINLSLSRDKEVLEVRVRSSWHSRNVTLATAVSDFREAKRLVSLLAAARRAFAELTTDRVVEFVLINDYGTGMMEICRLHCDRIVWADGLDSDR